MTWSSYGPSCGRSPHLCRCSHSAPCDYGWIAVPPQEHNGQTYQRVAPCPMCRPELAARLAETIERNSVNVRSAA